MTQNEKPWKGICCKQCWFAKHPKCRCRCKGKNHQAGLHKHLSDYAEIEEKEKEAKEKASKLKQIMMEG